MFNESKPFADQSFYLRDQFSHMRFRLVIHLTST
jgi:hypothetical protein